MENLRSVLSQIQLFEKEAHLILAAHESSKSRVVLLTDTYKRLSGLSLAQDELFRQALRCVENELYRSAHVMGWAGFMDFFEEKLAADGFARLKSVEPKWIFSNTEELRETIQEARIIDASEKMNLLARNEKNAIRGLLNKRNMCAHPSDYFPNLNETLGYISEILTWIEKIQKKP